MFKPQFQIPDLADVFAVYCDIFIFERMTQNKVTLNFLLFNTAYGYFQ